MPSTWRLFLTYAGASLVPVVLLGLVLAHEARNRGIAEGRAEAAITARAAIEPLLEDRPLPMPLPDEQLMALGRVSDRLVGTGQAVRLRLRNSAGEVVFSDDGSGFGAVPDDEAIDAARGEVVAHLTHLDSNSNDRGPAQQRVV